MNTTGTYFTIIFTNIVAIPEKKVVESNKKLFLVINHVKHLY